MSDTESKLIKTILEGPLSTQFEQIKSFYGLTNSSEVIRFLIRKEARQIQETVGPLFSPAEAVSQ